MLKIHHLRNATMIIESDNEVILIDPMLGDIGSFMPFKFLRTNIRKNPIVGLPSNSKKILDRVTFCLITHAHPDHIDQAGIKFLIKKNIPILCSTKDESKFRKAGLNIYQTLNYWDPIIFFNGEITGIPATHGYGFVNRFMGNVMGYLIKLPDLLSIYISSDTILTNDVKKVLKDSQPDISVVACGSARLDILKPLLMRMDDILKFVKMAPSIVIANHLEALDHCPTTRKSLKAALTTDGTIDKVLIPEDGDILQF